MSTNKTIIEEFKERFPMDESGEKIPETGEPVYDPRRFHHDRDDVIEGVRQALLTQLEEIEDMVEEISEITQGKQFPYQDDKERLQIVVENLSDLLLALKEKKDKLNNNQI